MVATYEGRVFVRSAASVNALLFANTSGEWWGTLSGPLGWAVRYDIDRDAMLAISVGDEVDIEFSEKSDASATGVGFKPVDDARPGQQVRVVGEGPPPFVESAPPEPNPPSGVREPRRPRPSPASRGAAADSPPLPG
jgi:hypothetical protein